LPEQIGPAQAYSVRIPHSGTGLLHGAIAWIEIHGEAVQAAEALTVDDLRVRLEDVQFDRRKRAITSVGASAITARVSEESAARYLARRGPDFQNLRFTFRENEVIVHAAPALLGLHVPVNVTGQPVLRSERVVDFEASRLALGPLSVPQPILSLLEQRLNPIFDLSTLHLPMRITSVGVEPGYAVIRGTASLRSEGKS
jgi:hypothetical protein